MDNEFEQLRKLICKAITNDSNCDNDEEYFSFYKNRKDDYKLEIYEFHTNTNLSIEEKNILFKNLNKISITFLSQPLIVYKFGFYYQITLQDIAIMNFFVQNNEFIYTFTTTDSYNENIKLFLNSFFCDKITEIEKNEIVPSVIIKSTGFVDLNHNLIRDYVLTLAARKVGLLQSWDVYNNKVALESFSSSHDHNLFTIVQHRRERVNYEPQIDTDIKQIYCLNLGTGKISGWWNTICTLRFHFPEGTFYINVLSDYNYDVFQILKGRIGTIQLKDGQCEYYNKKHRYIFNFFIYLFSYNKISLSLTQMMSPPSSESDDSDNEDEPLPKRPKPSEGFRF